MTHMPYSMRLEKPLCDKVLRIPGPPADAPGHDVFRTNIMVNPEGVGGMSWRTAQRDPETNEWTVTDYYRVAQENEGGIAEQKIVFSAVCYFDALHNLSEFQAEQAQFGYVAADDVCPDNLPVLALPLYKDAAQSACQPLDVKGLAHPAASGMILTPGTFDDEAYETVFRTADVKLNALVKKNSDAALAALSPARLLNSLPAKDDAVALIIADLSVQQDFRNALKATKDFTDTLFTISRDNGFNKRDYHEEYMILGSIFTLGLLPIYAHLVGRKDHSSRRYLELRAPSILKKETDKLPDGAEKKLFEDFNRAAQCSFYMAYASYMYDQYTKNKKGDQELKKGLSYIDKAITVGALAGDDAARLKRAFMAGKMPDKKQIAGDMFLGFIALEESIKHVFE